MKVLKLFIIAIFTYNISFANDNMNLTELFTKLNERGITIGEDISSDDLYRIIKSNNIKHQDINKFINQISNLLNSSLENKQKIIDILKQNPNSKTNKELLNYLNSDSTQYDNISKILLKDDENISNSKLFKYLKSMLN